MPERSGNQQDNSIPNDGHTAKTRREFLSGLAAGTVAAAGYFVGQELLTKEDAPHEEYQNRQKQIATCAAKYAYLEEFITSASNETDSYQPNQKLSQELFNFNARFRKIYDSYLSWSDVAANLLNNSNSLHLGVKYTVNLVLETHKQAGALAGLRPLVEAEIKNEQEKYKKTPQAMAQIKNYYDLITLEQKIADEIRLAGDIFLSKFNHIQI